PMPCLYGTDAAARHQGDLSLPWSALEGRGRGLSQRRDTKERFDGLSAPEPSGGGWLSRWGLVAAPLILIASLSLLWAGDPNSTLANTFFAPMALQELTLAVWLIFKGFDAAALASGSAMGEVA